VVYFYPADFTGGCTKQACGFRDDMKQLEGEGIEVVGISGDSPETHKQFKDVYDLNYTLLSDQDGSIAKKFGVPVNTANATVTVKIDGQEQQLTRGSTIKRWTFIIGRDGKIAYKNANVNAAEDSKAVLKAAKDLKG
jgi:peroxiredoxin Q/BCP